MNTDLQTADLDHQASSQTAAPDALEGRTLKDSLSVVQRLAGGPPSSGSVPVDDSGGSPLPDSLRSAGGDFGTDLSSVRVHTGSLSAGKMGAEAFTRGEHIHFASSSVDRSTLGHEVGHVIQQKQGRVQPTGSVGGNPLNDSPALESEADSLGAALSSGSELAVSGTPSGSPGSGGPIQRKASGQAVVQRKLNMKSGYTEALNWSSEALKLIATWESFEEHLEQCIASASPQNKRLRALKAFKLDMESRTIDNDKTVRENATQEIERQIEVARSLLAATGGTAPRESSDVEDVDGGKDLGLPGKTESEFGKVDTSGEPEKEEAEEGAPVKIQITLLDEDLFEKREGRLGELSGKASIGSEVTPTGASGSMGAQVSLFVGKKLEQTGTLVQAKYGQGRVKGEGSLGVKGELSGGAEGSYDLSEGEVSGSLKGKASAFAGGSFSVTPTVEITDSRGTKLLGTTATLGVSYGAGVEYDGELSLKDWRVVFKSKGKLALGLGGEWGISFDLDLGAITKKVMGK